MADTLDETEAAWPEWAVPELAGHFARMIPEEATNEPALLEASEHAAKEVLRKMPEYREIASKSVYADNAGRKSALAYMVAKDARRIRNDWLKQHGAYSRG